jgi:transcriptional regulator with XRE-family HTH domain
MEASMVSSVRALDVRSKMIGVLIRAARLRAGKTVKECAEWLGCSSHIMSQYEYGRRSISLPELELLAEIFDVPLDHLWDEEAAIKEEPTPTPLLGRLVELRHKEIGVLLRQARSDAGRTQKECAELLGVSPDTISKYELGGRPVPFTQLEVLASYLEVSMSSFLDRGEPMTGVSGEASQPELLAPEEAWESLPQHIKEFIRNPNSRPFLEVALRLYELPEDSLRDFAEAMLPAEDSGGRQAP